MKIEEIPKFDGNSYYIWRFRMNLFLTAEDLIGIVDGTIPKPSGPRLPPTGAGSIVEWEKRNAIALSYIANRVDNSQVHHLSSSTTAADAWSKLSTLYQSQAAVTKMYLKDELQTLQMKEGESVTKHVHQFKTLVDQLSAAGVNTSDEDQFLALMRSMPNSFRPMLTSLRGQSNLTLQKVITYLLQEEKMLKDQRSEPSTALFVARNIVSSGKKNWKNYINKKAGNFPRPPSGKPGGYNKPRGGSSFSREEEFPTSNIDLHSAASSSQKNPYSKMKCFYCGLIGHHIKDCRKKMANEGQRSKGVNYQANTAAYSYLVVACSTTFDQSDHNWYLDTGATHHMAHSIGYFSTYTPCASPQHVFLGDHSKLEIHGRGTVAIVLDNRLRYIVEDVLHIPKLQKNLFSVKQHDLAGGSAFFDKGCCELCSPQGDHLVTCLLTNDL